MHTIIEEFVNLGYSLEETIDLLEEIKFRYETLEENESFEDILYEYGLSPSFVQLIVGDL